SQGGQIPPNVMQWKNDGGRLGSLVCRETLCTDSSRNFSGAGAIDNRANFEAAQRGDAIFGGKDVSQFGIPNCLHRRSGLKELLRYITKLRWTIWQNPNTAHLKRLGFPQRFRKFHGKAIVKHLSFIIVQTAHSCESAKTPGAAGCRLLVD